MKYNGKERKCATCEYFCGERKLVKGVLGSPYVEVKNNRGNFCGKKHTKNDLKNGGVNYGTSCYERWSAIELELQNIKQKKDAKAEEKRIFYEQLRNESSTSASHTDSSKSVYASFDSSTKQVLRNVKRKQELAKRGQSLAKEAKKIEHWHRHYLIKCIVITLIAFAIGWLPTAIANALANSQKEAADLLIELGHKPAEAAVQEYMNLYNGLHTTSLILIMIPVAILLLGVILYFACRKIAYKKAISKKENIEHQLKELSAEIDALKY